VFVGHPYPSRPPCGRRSIALVIGKLNIPIPTRLSRSRQRRPYVRRNSSAKASREIGREPTRPTRSPRLRTPLRTHQARLRPVLIFLRFGVRQPVKATDPGYAQIWTAADVRRDGFSLETALGKSYTKAGVRRSVQSRPLIEFLPTQPFERRFRVFPAGLAPVDCAERTLVDVFGVRSLPSSGRQWPRSQPVSCRELLTESASRPDAEDTRNKCTRVRRHPRIRS